jgi:nucleotide-binding universal stress UspA family protein
MFKNILVATDGSNHAKRAVKLAAEMARVNHARLTILNVQPLSLTLDDLRLMPKAKRFPRKVMADINRVRDALQRSADADMTPLSYIPAPRSAIEVLGKRTLQEAVKIAKRQKAAKITSVMEIGDPAQQILERAKKSRADLIVIGTRGLSRVGELILGSVSHKVLHMARCPCLTVK